MVGNSGRAASTSTPPRHRRLLLLLLALLASQSLAFHPPTRASSGSTHLHATGSRRGGSTSGAGGGPGHQRRRDWDEGDDRRRQPSRQQRGPPGGGEGKPNRPSSASPFASPEDMRGQGLFRALSTLTGNKGKGSGSALPSKKPSQQQQQQQQEPKRKPPQSASSNSGNSFGGSVRLNKLLAHTGAAPSRRVAEAMIGQGRVSVDGAVVTDVGHKVPPVGAAVCVDGKPVAAAVGPGKGSGGKGGKDNAAWVKVHKPKGTLATLTDALGRKCLAELVPDAGAKGLRPVGRLGREAAGLLLLTDDLDVAHVLAGRAAGLVRVYKVVVEKGMPSPQALSVLAKGIVLKRVEEGEEDDDGGDDDRQGKRGRGPRRGQGRRREGGRTEERGEALPPMTVMCVDYFADRMEAVLEVTVRDGRDRLLRRAFEQLGHPVKSVTRLMFGPIDLGALRAGEARRVSAAEAVQLKGMLAAYRKKAARKGRRVVKTPSGGGGGGVKKGSTEEEEEEVDPDIEAFWDAVEDEEDQEEDGFYDDGDDDF